MLAAVPNTEWTSTSVARVYSDPFGGIRGNTDADVPGDHRFLGATRDADSGLTLLGARYYDPVTGCFISVDPILNLEVPAHLHAYAYGFNNPVTFSDASGLEPKDQNGNFDGDPYSSPSTTSWAHLNGCGGNLSCVGTWMNNFQLNFYGGLAEGVGGLLLFACSSLCMVPMSVNSAVTAFSDWDAHLANEQAKGEQFREWWSDPWNNFWRPIGEDWANNPGHAWGGTVFTAGTLVVPGGAAIKAGTVAVTTTRVTSRLQRLVDDAATSFDSPSGALRLSPAQFAAAATNKNLEAMFRGSVIDRAVREAVKRDSWLASKVSSPTTGPLRPDFVLNYGRGWLDMTTVGQWPKHVDKYSDVFGRGIHLVTG